MPLTTFEHVSKTFPATNNSFQHIPSSSTFIFIKDVHLLDISEDVYKHVGQRLRGLGLCGGTAF